MNILSKSNALTKINSLKGRTATAHKDIQAVAVSAISHARDFGDFTLASKLVKAVSTPNATQLRKYFAGHGPFRWDKKTGGFKKTKKGNAFDLDGAIATDWASFAKESAAPVYDHTAATKSVYRSIKAKYDAAVTAGDEQLAEVLAVTVVELDTLLEVTKKAA